MKPLQDCKYTAFISYAHADDVACFDWISQFHTELDRGLRAVLRGVRLPPLHLSGENGPVAGVLGEELERRVAESFAMIIVVHDNYAQSAWCLKELEYFKSLFGDEGFRNRLYIVALSESAMLGVAGGTAWKQLMPSNDQVWMPFFQSADRTRPIPIYTDRGSVAASFAETFERLRSDFAGKLRVAASTTAAATAAATAAPTQPQTLPALAGTQRAAPALNALMGFVPPDVAPRLAAASQQLAAGGLKARMLSSDIVFNAFAEFDQAEHLILAFDDSGSAGHLQVQRDAWLSKGRPAEGLHWLDLRAAPPPAAQWAGAAAFVAGLGVISLTVSSLLQKLVPQAAETAPASQAVRAARIYIESNHNERTLWQPLGEQIRQKWDALCQQLAPELRPPLNLRTRGLPVDDIDSQPLLDDADGVILLWGRKTQDSLIAQINKVEDKTSPGRDAPAGIVAFLMPPQASDVPVPARSWQVLRFNAADESQIDVMAEERDDLTAFLKRVFLRCQQRQVTATTASAAGAP
jgi:TIR domain